MSYSISTLLTRNLHDVFGENDPERRRAAIDEIFLTGRARLSIFEPARVPSPISLIILLRTLGWRSLERFGCAWSGERSKTVWTSIQMLGLSCPIRSLIRRVELWGFVQAE